MEAEFVGDDRYDVTKNARDATETLLLILPSFIFMVITVLVSSLLISPQRRVLTFLFEFLLIVIPVILNVTVLSSYVTNIVAITCLLLGLHLIMYLAYANCKRKKNIRPSKRASQTKKDYITNCRATINLISVIAILAVDFKVFPPRYSKTHRTGFSLMDVGVGLFVLANGIVGPEVRGKKDSIKSSVKGSALLLVIGVLRLILTKLSHYRVSNKEYGVHWNFFMTLAFTKIFSSCILNCVKVKYVIFNAVLITVAHETLLQMSFKKWVFDSNKRDTFLDANKEGIVSTVGYVALYLFSLYGAYFLRQTERSFKKTNLKFFLINTLALTMTFFCNQHFEVSRRLANAGYVFWILFIGNFMSWLFYLAENGEKFLFHFKLRHYVCSPSLYEAINYNGLVFFLLANVLTGLVNLSLETKLVPSVYSLLILVGYMFVNCGLCFFLYLKEWKLKL